MAARPMISMTTQKAMAVLPSKGMTVLANGVCVEANPQENLFNDV
jgi:hypothetical protein